MRRAAFETANDDVAGTGPDPGSDARTEIDVTGITRPSFELPTDGTPVSLGDTAGTPNVLTGAIVLLEDDRFTRERQQAVDALLGNPHTT